MILILATMLSTLGYKVTKGAIKKKQSKDPCVIPLRPVASKTVDEDKTITFKLRSEPTKIKSQTYKMFARVFTEGTPEEWLEQQKNIHKVLVGQDITMDPNQFVMASQLLADKALNDFKSSITTQKAAGSFNKTTNNLKIVLMDISVEMFLKRAIQLQRRALHQNLRKPPDMLTATYHNCLYQMSDNLEQYPNGVSLECLDDEDKKEILEYMLPGIWRTHMKILMFDCANKNTTEIVAFCKNIEGVETEHGSLGICRTFPEDSHP